MKVIPWQLTVTVQSLLKPGRPFIKMHGLRNDFIIVDARHTPFKPSVALRSNGSATAGKGWAEMNC
jgi:hypothetical protein